MFFSKICSSYPTFLKDSVVSDLCDINRRLIWSMDIIPVPTDEAVEEAEKRATNVESKITKWYQKQYNNKNLTINTKDTIYRFNPTNVTYINYDKNSRKTYINFIYNNKIPCNLTLKKLQKLLGKNYILTKSCCIVNVEQIYNIDKVNKVITFNNGIQINMLSKNGLKQILEYIKEQ